MHDIKLLRLNIFFEFNFFVINKLGRFIEIFNILKIFVYIDLKKSFLFFKKINFYSNKSILRFSILADIFFIIFEIWVDSIKLVLRLFIFIAKNRHKMLYLLYYYRYLNDIDLIDLLYTNIIIYRVQIKLNIKSIFINVQKR